VPPGGDVYLASLVLHDWPDDQAQAILANIAAAGGSSARQSAALGRQSLFTDRAIERFAEEVCVAGVAGSLLDEVQQHPPEREVPPVTQHPGR
jgi:hypothetical protein